MATKTDAPHSTTALLRHLSAVNESVIAHEAEEQQTNHAYDDTAHAVLALGAYVKRVWANMGTELDDAGRKEILKGVLKATTKANEYLDASVTHVKLGLDLLRTANEAVAAVMNHDHLIGA